VTDGAAVFDDDDPLARVGALIRDVPDFPEPGVVFRDITPVLADAEAFTAVSVALAALVGEADVVVGVEARGFLLGAAAALTAGTGMVPIRKAGKLPRDRVSAEYSLEYGTATLELHTDSIGPGQRVLLVDDVLATGGTLAAAVALVEQLGAVVTAVSVVIELAALGGRQRVAPHPVHALWIT
jgi:adenine phosphoribosyltransferase